MNEIDNLIIEYLEGSITPADKVKLEEWVGKSQSNQTYYYQQSEIWIAAQALSDRNGEAAQEFARFKRRIHWKKTFRIGIRISRYAAAVVIGAGIAGAVLWSVPRENEIRQTQYRCIETTSGSRSRILLDDGTEVWLNASSKLTCDNLFSIKNRNISLEGEAYFHVTRNEVLPFVVDAGEVSIQVLGTKFNVRSYDNDAYIDVTLSEGKIALRKDSDETVYHLQPAQEAIYDKSAGKISIKPTDPAEKLSWIDGRFFFNEFTLMEISKRLERAFDVSFVFENDEKQQLTFYADFDHSESLSGILDVLSSSGQFRYRIAHNVVIIY